MGTADGQQGVGGPGDAHPKARTRSAFRHCPAVGPSALAHRGSGTVASPHHGCHTERATLWLAGLTPKESGGELGLSQIAPVGSDQPLRQVQSLCLHSTRLSERGVDGTEKGVQKAERRLGSRSFCFPEALASYQKGKKRIFYLPPNTRAGNAVQRQIASLRS